MVSSTCGEKNRGWGRDIRAAGCQITRGSFAGLFDIGEFRELLDRFVPDIARSSEARKVFHCQGLGLFFSAGMCALFDMGFVK